MTSDTELKQLVLAYCRPGVSKLRPAGQIRPRRYFVNNVNIIYLRRTCWFGRMQNFPKQSYYIRCPVLERLC